ncbi:FAD-dependent oxidoreductase [Proteocatella sphenisci]|uniref:FAD-dependent oxidoreductase n=1 Tax=Proteocatella sphenisci TaxID=181070 RepID=UPI0004914778|nr:FAD-dependent oxidoreductase [Proteocatella sphenisci]
MYENKLKTLILVGGGHAHLYLIKQMISDKLKGYRTVLISSESKQYYSGMASGYIEGTYTEKDFTVDLPRICSKSAVIFIKDTVILINPAAKTLETASGEIYKFDILSVDTGSDISGSQIHGARDFAHLIKPLSNLKIIKKILIDAPVDLYNVVVVGAGAAGVEIALAIRALGIKENKKYSISIVNSNSDILKGYAKGVEHKTVDLFKRNEIKLIINQRANLIEKNYILMQSGFKIKYDLLLLATGSLSHPLYRESGFCVDDKGYMVVNDYLQNIEFPYILGAGDCIKFENYDYVKKVGVYAIREAPILWKNIKHIVDNEELEKYVPQKNYLSIISLGNKTAIASYKKLFKTGRISWYVKDWIDRTFIKQYH